MTRVEDIGDTDRILVGRSKSKRTFVRTGLSRTMDVGPCHHGMARPEVAEGGMASYMQGSCE